MIVVKKYKKVNEEEPVNTTNVSQDVSSQTQSKAIQLNTQIAELLNKKMTLKTQYQNDVRNIEAQIIQLQKQKADIGENVDVNCLDENKVELRFSRKLYEAVTNKTDEMFAAITIAFDNVDNISIKPHSTRCRTFAKNIISYLNKVNWYGTEHTTEFIDYVRNMLNNSQVSLSNTEKETFIDKLTETLKSNPIFGWIFGVNN